MLFCERHTLFVTAIRRPHGLLAGLLRFRISWLSAETLLAAAYFHIS